MKSKLLDDIKGVFSGKDSNEEKQQEPKNTPEQEKLVQMVLGDYTVFKENRQKIEDTWKQEDRFYEGGKKHWEGLRDTDPDNPRPDSVDNIAFSQVESIVSALTGWVPTGKFEPVEPGDDEKAQAIQKYMPYELRQIKFKPKHITAVRRFVIHGLLLYMPVYDPTVEGGRGQNRFIGQNDIIPLDYGSFFPDPRIGNFLNLQQGKAHIIRVEKPMEYFHENESYGEQGKKVTPSISSDTRIFDDQKDTGAPDQTKTCELIQYFYRGKPKLLTKEDKAEFKELADTALAEGKDPSIHLAKMDGTMKGVHCIHVAADGTFLKHTPYVYDHGQYPIVARSLFPVEGSLWPKGYMRDLISPQIMLNKFSELAVEQTAKMGNGAIIYQEGSIAEPQKTIWKRLRSRVGAMLPTVDINGVKEIEGKGPPPMIMNFIQHWLQILQKIPRRFDSSNGGANFQGESGRHAEALQAAAQGHLSTPAELIEDALCEVFEQYIELVAQFYKTERIGRVLGKSTSISRDTLIKAAPTEFETSEGVVPVMEEYVPQFDIAVSIGVETPRDREYWVNTAWQLFDKQMIDAKAVQYTIENGRMEPFEIIEERLQKDAMIQQQMMEHEQMIQQLNAENQQLMEVVQQLQGNDLTQQNETIRLLSEQQDKEHQRAMEQRKMDNEERKVMMMGRG